ncbi:MAG: potassium channel family protein [Sedimenticolaceae bacterium]
MKAEAPRADNFAYLTSALVIFLLLGSLVTQFIHHDLAEALLEGALILTLAAGVWSIRSEKGMFKGGLGLTAGVLLVSLGGLYLESRGLTAVHYILLLIFFFAATWVTLKQVLFSGHVDGNTIVGAICVYLLLGMIWALLFGLLEGLVPGSFKGLSSTGANSDFMDLLYFSFVSLTTMGFGDITPTLPLARYLTFMEGIVGQLYLAIMISSLVGVRVSNWSR